MAPKAKAVSEAPQPKAAPVVVFDIWKVHVESMIVNNVVDNGGGGPGRPPPVGGWPFGPGGPGGPSGGSGPGPSGGPGSPSGPPPPTPKHGTGAWSWIAGRWVMDYPSLPGTAVPRTPAPKGTGAALPIQPFHGGFHGIPAVPPAKKAKNA
jgi:hypothetical protein